MSALRDVGRIEDVFILRKSLGRGAYGEVYLVQKKKGKDKTEYALKIYTDVSQEDVQREYDIVRDLISDLGHPRLARYYDIFEGTYQGSGRFFVLMEFIRGYDLDGLIECITDRHYLLSGNELNVFMEQMLKTIGYLHSHNIAHLDIKPGNILFSRSTASLVLVDYGTLCNVREKPSTCLFIGTSGYMSPEMVLGFEHIVEVKKPEVFFASDVWSLGTLFLEVATGKSIYRTEYTLPDDVIGVLKKGKKTLNFNQAIEKVKKLMRRPPMIAKPRGKLQKLINTMLTIDYRKRPKVNEILEKL